MLSRAVKVNILRQSGAVLVQPHRTATVLRRTHKPPVLWPYGTQHQINQQVFKDIKYQRYEVVTQDDEEDWATQPIKIILLRSLEDYGKRGQILSIPRQIALKELLLPQLAIYASPENLELYKDIVIPEDSIQYSSDIVRKAIPRMSRLCLPIIMSRDHSWTVEPWHVRAAMRKIGLEVNDVNAILLPEQKISGPNENLEAKEFAVQLKINDFETLAIRCVLFHWSQDDDLSEECPSPGWDVRFNEPIFEADRELLMSLPRPKLDPASMSMLKDKHEIMQKYESWRTERDRKLFSS